MRKVTLSIAGLAVLGALLTPGISAGYDIRTPVGCVAQGGLGDAVITENSCSVQYQFPADGNFHYRFIRASQWRVRACTRTCRTFFSQGRPQAGVIKAPGRCPCYADIEIYDQPAVTHPVLGILVKGKTG